MRTLQYSVSFNANDISYEYSATNGTVVQTMLYHFAVMKMMMKMKAMRKKKKRL